MCWYWQEFGLIDKKELAPLQELIESIISPYWAKRQFQILKSKEINYKW